MSHFTTTFRNFLLKLTTVLATKIVKPTFEIRYVNDDACLNQMKHVQDGNR